MKTFKIVVALFSLVALGFVAGFYTNRYLVKQNISRVANMRYAKGFEESMYEKIHATDKQQTQIATSVEKYGEQIATVYQESRTKRRALMDSLRMEISPYLTQKQIEELDHFCYRFYTNPTKQTASN